MSIKPIISALSCAVGLAFAAGSAQAGTKDDIRDLQARMAGMEQTISAQSAMTVRISELEREIQELTGQIEELTYALDQSNRRLDSISAALAGGNVAGETALSDPAIAARGPVDLSTGDPIADQISSVSPAGDATPSIGGGDVSLPLDPNVAFDYASQFLLEGDYQRAKSAFKLYVDAFPSHNRTPDAQFRLGEIHLALGENAAAAEVFISHIRNYPNDPRAAEAYLKLGTAFSRLENPKQACTVFKTMKTKFPEATSAVTQRADIEMARISCQ